MQAQALTFQSLIDEAIADAPALSLALFNGLSDELKSRPQYHMLLEAWNRRRVDFSASLESALGQALAAAREGRDPLGKDRPRDADSLSLVDERQALQDVGIAHVIATIEDQSRAELHQLGNFFAALRGIARPLKSDNPLRAALYAHALNQAVQQQPLDADGRYALMRAAADPLARHLHEFYSLLCRRLREAKLSEMVASHGAGERASDLRQRQFKALSLQDGRATLDHLAQRVEDVNSRPQRLGQAEPPPRMGPASALGAPGADLLSRLYDQILADPTLLPPLKAVLARLQVAIVRLSRQDVSLLRRQDHPTWQLLNRVAAHGAGFARADDPDLREFLQALERQIQPLLETAQPSAAMFQTASAEVEHFIREQALRRSRSSASSLASLEREQHRDSWRRLLREQLQAQLDEAGAGQLLRDFLLGPWTEVITQTMVKEGRDSAQAQRAVDLVDRLLASVQPPRDAAALKALRVQLPGLVQALEQGMADIQLPADKRQAFMAELMAMHGRVLRGLPAQPDGRHEAAHAAAPSPEDLLQQLLSERESQLPSRWAHERVDRGVLPTVPLGLYQQHDSAEARKAMADWLNQLQIGAWFHLFVQGEWRTAQIAWISESRQLFLFVGQDAQERHSLTRGALEQLLVNGLIAHLEEEDLVQRAMGSLLQDLDDQA